MERKKGEVEESMGRNKDALERDDRQVGKAVEEKGEGNERKRMENRIKLR